MSNPLVRRTKIVTTLGPATDAPPVLRALVVSSLTDPIALTRVHEAGVEGYVEKDASPEQLEAALAAVMFFTRHIDWHAQDAGGTPGNVTADTAVSLSLQTGTGSLAGTLGGTIAAGTHSVTISGVTYNQK